MTQNFNLITTMTHAGVNHVIIFPLKCSKHLQDETSPLNLASRRGRSVSEQIILICHSFLYLGLYIVF